MCVVIRNLQAVGAALTALPFLISLVRCTSEVDLESRWGNDWAFSGVSTFNHLPYARCLVNRTQEFDIAIIGVPFDSLTTYRSGRHLSGRSFNPRLNLNPYESWARVVDCGDIPVIPNDPVLALQQMEEGFVELLTHETPMDSPWQLPHLVLLGGDHSIVLPMLRALKSILGEPVALLHFDAHIDTLAPDSYPRHFWKSEPSEINHGTVFWHAIQEGLLLPSHLVHAGVHGRISGLQDFTSDDSQGFKRISAEEIDDLGVDAIIETIYSTIGSNVPVYVSIDIDVLDPAFAPGTGAPETGGWSSRELMKVMTVLSKLNVIGADIVEVAPAYDSQGGDTAFAAANLAYEVISMMVLNVLEDTSVKEVVGRQPTETCKLEL
ncbi:hypothetical protein HYFRA_00000418 [Hymenoscyphus fraxineus]|uniref:Agmatinase n=1 Tax=Hymenoscyphus fraxineus TaxID=746836 RepID=A0A9N9L2T6_9HELO|nr:hypothetical protein HYFRA_00000418 [Hymenoscyphus fraxineus]